MVRQRRICWISGLAGLSAACGLWMCPEPYVRVVGTVCVLVLVVVVTRMYGHCLFFWNLAHCDPLTGLYNRTYGSAYLQKSQHRELTPVSVIVGDVNGLKKVNDEYGHAQGDVLLQQAAGIFMQCCRSSDVVFRWGGDEFIVVLPGASHEESLAVCNRIREKCKTVHFSWGALSIALGCATTDKGLHSLQDYIEKAESNMYVDKRQSKQCTREGTSP